MHYLTLKSILNGVQPSKGFVYADIRFSEVQPQTIEVLVLPRLGSQARCSGCGQCRPGYDQWPTRLWQRPPLWTFLLGLIYTPGRVDCPTCGVVVEQVPWGRGQHRLTEGFRLLLAHWAKKLSWEEVALAFEVNWADVYGAVRWVVDWGLKHRDLLGIVALGVDEVCVRLGRVFWRLVYQIDPGSTRLVALGQDRTHASLERCLAGLGPPVCAGVRYVCSALWRPYLAAVRRVLPQGRHILARFHLRQWQKQAVDQIRRAEAHALAGAGLQPRRKKLRWALLKKRRNWTGTDRRRRRALRTSGLAALRAYWLVAAFEHFWDYVSPTWAGKFLSGWCRRVRRSRLRPLITVAKTLAEHRQLLLNWFRAQREYSGGVIAGLNNKVKLTFRKAYGFRTDRAREVALFHVLGKLPEPELTHRFF